MRDGGWQTTVGTRPRGPHPRAARPRAHRQPGGRGRPGLRHGRHRLEPPPHRRAGRGRRRAGRRRSTTCSPPRTSSRSTSCSARAPAASSRSASWPSCGPTRCSSTPRAGRSSTRTPCSPRSSAGRLGGVGLDVFDEEPLPVDHPLRTAPRTLLTPHLGYVTDDVYATFFSGVVEDVTAYLDGSPIRIALTLGREARFPHPADLPTRGMPCARRP